MQCQSCGAACSPTASFCPGCGTAVVRPRSALALSPLIVGSAILALLIVLLIGYLIGRAGPHSSASTATGEPAAIIDASANDAPSDTSPATPAPGAAAPTVAAPPPVSPMPVGAGRPSPMPAFVDRSVTTGEWRYYVILGSGPPGTGAIPRRASQLYRCLGYEPGTDFTYAFDGLAPDIEFVHLGGYASQGQAQQVLQWARSCAGDAYIRRARFKGD